MEIGDLRRRVMIVFPSSYRDDKGGCVITWLDEVEVWAKIKPVSGQVFTINGALRHDLTHEVTVRYRQLTPITVQKRLRYGSRMLEIVAVIDIEERHEYVRLLCRERL
jgi:SPP1 family predicted phage head-tail adaptor